MAIKIKVNGLVHNVTATSPFGISFGGGTTSDGTFFRGRVGHDLKVTGITGVSFPATNFVCSTDIVHDVVLTNSAQSAGEWVVGDSPELCGAGDTIGHDLVVQNNLNLLEISDNQSLTGAAPLSWGIGHDLRVTGNAQAPVVEGNTVYHDAVCQSNVTTDGPNEPGGIPDALNIAGHNNTCN